MCISTLLLKKDAHEEKEPKRKKPIVRKSMSYLFAFHNIHSIRCWDLSTIERPQVMSDMSHFWTRVGVHYHTDRASSLERSWMYFLCRDPDSRTVSRFKITFDPLVQHLFLKPTEADLSVITRTLLGLLKGGLFSRD